jgi:Flp pilus assembly protein TadG
VTALRDRWHAVTASGDEGQLILLILAYAIIAALLVTVVVDVSKVFLYRRSLVAAADGAALRAANQPDLAAVYNGTGATLPLSRAGTNAAVRQYAVDAELADRFEGFDVAGVETDGVTVTVTLRAAVPLPFVNLISSHWSDGYPVRAVARAQSPLTR